MGWGSEGDLRPMVALSAALRRSGHSVQLDLTPIDGSDFGPLCASLGIPLRVYPERLDLELHTAARGADSVDPLKLSRDLVARAFEPHLELFFQKALELCAQSDLIIWQYSAWYARAAAQQVGIPDVSVQLFPGLAPTRFAPPPGLPNLGPLNRLAWSAAAFALDRQFLRTPRAFFAAKGLPPLRHVMPELLFSERLNLHAFSPQLVPRPPDWDATHQVVGRLFLEAGQTPWTPSAGLTAFLADGPPPVLLSMGSMEHLAPARARDLLIGAAKAAGVRAILQTKRGAPEEGRDGDLYFLPWAPHEALLPRCALAVHHAGAGTSHAVLEAGLPAVAVPFIFEQALWAKRLHAAGVASRPLPFWKVSSGQLAAAIRSSLAAEPLRLRARELAQRLKGEGGAAGAVGLLSELAASPRRPQA